MSRPERGAGAAPGEGARHASPRDIAPLLDALCAEGLLGGGRRTLVERDHAEGAAPLEELLLDSGFVDAPTLDRLTGGTRVIDLDADGFVPDERAVACLEVGAARRLRVVPIGLDPHGTTLVLASDGAPDLPRRDAVRRALPTGLDIDWRVASASGVARALDRCYGFALAIDDVLAACDGGDGIARLVDALLSDAVARRASDIHLSPEERFVRVRYRLDGVLSEVRCLQRRHLEAMVVRLKVLAGADIAETRRPQDGRFSRRLQGARVDFRLSCFPLATGENVVLRVLARRRAPLALEALVPSAGTLATLRRMVRRPDGLVVVCGPTGAGKTTTLYALLGEHDLSALNVMSLEDPIEHPTIGVRQAAVDAARGLDYASGVRALLRQDPDVLLIGEVRDAQSCAVALRAALTGHQVLTSVHAGDAVAAIGRLRELGAAPGVLAEVLAGVVSQRLLRTRCGACEGHGDALCRHCGGRGLHGRRAVFETLLPDARLRARLGEGADADALMQAAREAGHVTLRERADALVDTGITTAVEVERVLGPAAPGKRARADTPRTNLATGGRGT